jgi:TolB-like protein
LRISLALVPEVGLGPRYIVEGSVRRSGDDTRVVARLIDATTDQQL